MYRAITTRNRSVDTWVRHMHTYVYKYMYILLHIDIYINVYILLERGCV